MSNSKDIHEKAAMLEQKLHRLQVEMNSIHQIGKTLSSELRTRRLLPLIMNEVTRLMNAERSTFYIVDEERGELWSQIAQKAEIQEIRLNVGVGIAGYVAESGEVINIPDAYKDSRFNPEVDKKTGFTTRSILCMPIFEPIKDDKIKPAIIGVLQVLNKKDGVFTKDDEELLGSLASQIAVTIINSRLYSALEKRVSELNLLFDVEKELNSVEKQEELMSFLLEQITKTLKIEAAFIGLLDEDSEKFLTKTGKNLSAEVLNSPALTTQNSVIQKVLESGQLYLCNKAQDDDLIKSAFPDNFPLNILHFVCVPLTAGDKLVGILLVFNKSEKNEFFRQDDINLVTSFTSQIARSIETMRLRDEKMKADRLASIGNMMSTIVHDLRTPMNNIYGFVDLLQEEDDAELREEYAGIIIEQIKTLTNMTTDVLDFAKGKTSILPVKAAVDKLILNFTKLFEKDVRKKGFEFETSCNADAMIYVDPEKVNRIFMNIMKNALEAMEPGGKFSISAERMNGEVEICLSDTGAGIPAEIRDRLFDSFVTSGKEGGTGLGLAIVQKLVHEQKGRIEVESEPGKGTTFKIYFKRL